VQYDSSDGSVILITYPKAGANNTPVVGKWDCDTSWPFSNVNAEWLSALSQSYGSYVAGKLTNEPWPYLGANYLFLSNNYSGQVITIDPSDGSVAGTWAYSGAYSAAQSFKLMGENAAGQPVGGSGHASAGSYSAHKWDISNLNSWASAGAALGSGQYRADAPAYKRAEKIYSNYCWVQPLCDSDKTLLGLSGCVYWLNAREFSDPSEMFLIHLDPDADTYREAPFAQDAGRRSMGNFSDKILTPSIRKFISVGGIPWFIGWCIGTADIEDDNPGGRTDRQIGLIISAVGPGTVKYTMTAGVGGVPSIGTPKRMAITIPTAAKNYLNSEQYQKHQFRFQVASGGWSDWRCGVQELSALDQVVGGHAAWSAWSSGQLLEVEHRLGAGWPYAWDTSVVRNPGETGDPSVETVGTADAAPPREVVAQLWYGPAESGGGLL
jgi:hypothetical protein